MRLAILLVISLLATPLVLGARLEWAPVVLLGEEVPDLDGAPISQLHAFRYAGGWEEVRVQVDERDNAWDPMFDFDQYLWSGLEGDGLDDNDEIVLLASDAGTQAPDASAPAQVTTPGYEIRVHDPIDAQTRYLYLFRSTTLGDPGLAPLVSLTPSAGTCIPNPAGATDCGPGATIETATYTAVLPRRWVFDDLRLHGAYGNGADLIDRLKYRVYDLYAPTAGIGNAESEESWAVLSLFTGQKAGAIRAIRQVNDAASADNSTYVRTIFYPSLIERKHNLRVHALNYLWVYTDYSRAPVSWEGWYNGAPIARTLDGSPDAIPATPMIWTSQASSGAGSFATIYTLSGLTQATRSNFLNDDASFYDGTGEDQQTIGADGFKLTGIVPEQWSGTFTRQIIPLTSSASAIELFESYRAHPLSVDISVHDGSSGGCTDADGDGYGAGCLGPDCDDADPSVHALRPCSYDGSSCGSHELCVASCPTPPSETCDALDNDCDGQVDEGFDGDDDGFYPASCTGYAQHDCDDSASSINPAGNEECGNTIDEDCSGAYCRPGDVTEDGVVDVFDLTLVGSRFDCFTGVSENCWDEKARDADADASGAVDVADLNQVSQHFGTSY